MAISDSAIQRVRARIDAFDADPKRLAAVTQLTIQREQLSDLKTAIETCVDGGSLADFARTYGKLFQPGWDVWLAKDMADHPPDDEVNGQIRKMMRAPQDGEAAQKAIDQLARLIEQGTVVRDPAKSGSAYAPILLSNCCHAQQPQVWHQYTAKRQKTLNALVPELWEQDERPASHGAQYWVFNGALTVLADALHIEAWQLAVKLEASSSKEDPLESRGRYWLMALGDESKHWDTCHAEGIAFIGCEVPPVFLDTD